MASIMEGKRGLIMGLANEKSLAWGIAQKLHEHGAELAFSFQGEALEKRVRPLAAQLGSDFCFDCDVSQMDALDTAFETLKSRWETIDFLVHAIGFSDKNELRGKFVDTSLENFLMTLNVSAGRRTFTRSLISVLAVSSGKPFIDPDTSRTKMYSRDGTSSGSTTRGGSAISRKKFSFRP